MNFKTTLGSLLPVDDFVREIARSRSVQAGPRLVVAALLVAALAGSSAAQTISTGQYNNNRTGANLNETLLNTTNVNVTQFGKIASLPLDGREYGNPLFIPNVSVPLAGGGTRTTNVLYVATQKNTIFAFDANTLSTTPLWQTNLGAPVPAQSAAGGACPAFSAGNELGILSTPVIDITTNTIYAVSTSPTSSGTAYEYFLNALDITTGKPKFGSPVQIQGQVPGNGYDSVNGFVTLNQDTTHAQRTALLLSGGNVYMGFASCGPDFDPWHGWMFSYNASNLSQNWVFNSTPNDMRGGIWQSGFGPVADTAGNIYFVTANGDPSNADPYSDSVVMLTPAGVPTAYQFTNWSQISTDDLDISSAGLIRVPNTSYLLSGGKMGIVAVLNSSGGNLTLQQSFQATSPCPTPITSDATCHKMHGDAFWSDGGTGGYLYVWGSSSTDPLNAFHFVNGSFPIVSGSAPTPSSQNTSISLGKSSAALSVSSNQTQSGSGILWVNAQTTLYAFDATNVATQLWNNSQNAARDGGFQFTHWVEPIVAQGHVYLPWYNNDAGGIAVFGLLGTASTPDFSLNVAPGSETVVAGNSTTYSVTVSPLNGFNGTVSLTSQGLPSGVTGTFNPASVNTTGASTLTVSTSTTTPPGSTTFTITGTSGTLTHSVGGGLTVSTASSSGVQVSLSPVYNRTGIVTDGKTFSGGLDGDGNAYSANLLGSSQTYNDLTFAIGPPDVPNVVSNGATIPLPAGVYSALSFLGTAVNGPQDSQVFTVTYADGTTQTFTQSLNNWRPGPSKPGETIVLSMPYRDMWSGTENVGTFDLFAYSFTLYPTKTVASLTLPNNPNVVVVAVALVPSGMIVPVSLASSFNRNGIVTDGTHFTNTGVDLDGDSYSSNLLGTSLAFNGSTFTFGPANAPDVVSNAVIPLPNGQFSKLNMLATAVNGFQKNQSFIVTYTDSSTSVLTQSLSNWVPAGNQVGETTVLTMPYADMWNGTQKTKSVAVYGYSLALNPAKTVASIALPSNTNVVVLGLSLVP
jgi:hypothetical protein